MRRPVAIVGMGQLGGVFAQGLARLGRPVLPLLRGDDLGELVAYDPELVLVTVGERDLDGVLASLPHALRGRVGLVQNELLPPDWEAHGLEAPTVAVVWFEKKAGRAAHPILPTPIAGPHRALLVEALARVDLPAQAIEDDALPFALVRKNLYILGANLAGLRVGGTTSGLGAQHRAFTTEVLTDVLALEQARLGQPLPHDALLAQAFRDFDADPDHAATGRSAPDRLTRALRRADAHGLPVPTLRSLQPTTSSA